MIFIQKKNEQIKSYFIKANEKINSGDAESALEYVTKLEESKEENLANYYLAPLYIDIGAAKEDVPMVLRGIDLIDKNFDVWSKIGSPESMYCKLGDGYLFYYDMTGERYLNNKIVLLEAKNNYKNALLAEDMDSNLKALILTKYLSFFARLNSAASVIFFSLTMNFFGISLNAVSWMWDLPLLASPKHIIDTGFFRITCPAYTVNA